MNAIRRIGPLSGDRRDGENGRGENSRVGDWEMGREGDGESVRMEFWIKSVPKFGRKKRVE